MGFFDTVKEKANALAADAGRAGKVTAAQARLAVLQTDVRKAERDLGHEAFTLIERGELRHPHLDAIAEQLRSVLAEIREKEAEIASLRGASHTADPDTGSPAGEPVVPTTPATAEAAPEPAEVAAVLRDEAAAPEAVEAVVEPSAVESPPEVTEAVVATSEVTTAATPEAGSEAPGTQAAPVTADPRAAGTASPKKTPAETAAAKRAGKKSAAGTSASAGKVAAQRPAGLTAGAGKSAGKTPKKPARPASKRPAGKKRSTAD